MATLASVSASRRRTRSRHGGSYVRAAETIAFEEQRLTSTASKRIGKAIAEVKFRRMAAPPAEIMIGSTGDPSLNLGYRLYCELRLPDKILRAEPEAVACAKAIEAAPNRRISAANFVEAAIVIDGSRDPIAEPTAG